MLDDTFALNQTTLAFLPSWLVGFDGLGSPYPLAQRRTLTQWFRMSKQALETGLLITLATW